MPLEVRSPFEPKGDQPEAIAGLVEGLTDGLRFQTLLGATGTGKTYTMAKIIEAVQRPALVLAPNKILTAQLAAEFREFFPDAAVEFFISYYDYYQPEAYVPARDLFIEKDANINMELERLRHSTTRSLLTRKDVIVVASVSAIYGLGSPDEYEKLHLLLDVGRVMPRDQILGTLVTQQYERNDIELQPGRFRARGDVIEVWAAYEEQPLRVELWGDEVDRITLIDPLTGDETAELQSTTVFPARHYVTPHDKLQPAIEAIERDLEKQLAYFESVGKLIEKQRLRERTMYDLEMLRTLGYCNGIENYSRYLENRPPGSAPNTLLDYFPDDFITFLDESHVMLPQIRGMYNGDRARKQTLVDYGFRLPAALDNRPLTEEEFLAKVGQVVFVSATPTEREVGMSDQVAEQVIRPTGLVDPEVTVKPSRGQIDDLLFAARARAEKGERVLVTTLTKKMAEDLTEYLLELGVKVRYLHSEVDTIQRIEILRDLRLGVYDVIVGINLLREGLDLPEVSLVAVLDADKQGFLRSATALIQTIGRAARHINGQVIMYADKMTDAMIKAIDETNRRRAKQDAYNKEHHIEPVGIVKSVRDITDRLTAASMATGADEREKRKPLASRMERAELARLIEELEKQMRASARELEFERAAMLRDQIFELRAIIIEESDMPPWKKQKALAGMIP